MTQALLLGLPPLVLLWFISSSTTSANNLRDQAGRMQRDRNDFLAGYRTRTVNDQRTSWNYFTGTTYYSVPVQKSIPCPSQEKIDEYRKDSKRYRSRARLGWVILLAGPFVFVPAISGMFVE